MARRQKGTAKPSRKTNVRKQDARRAILELCDQVEELMLAMGKRASAAGMYALVGEIEAAGERLYRGVVAA